MGGGWDPTDVEAHFGPITISSAKRETSQQEKCIEESPKNNAEELVIKESLNQIKVKCGSGKKKIYVCICNFDPHFVKYADVNTRYADLLKTEELEVSPAIVKLLPLQFVKCLDTEFSWTELPQEFRDDMKTEVECCRNEELVSMKLCSSPASSPPIFHFFS